MAAQTGLFRRLLRWRRKGLRTVRRPLGVRHEELERRICLAADAGTSSTHLLDWQGVQVEALMDQWIVRAASPKVDANVFASGVSSAVNGGTWSGTSRGEGLWSLVAPGADAAEVLGWAGTTPWVDYVEPDFAIASTAIPNDTSFSPLWGLHNTGQSSGVVDADINAVEAWDITTGSRDVVIAVIDTGVDYGHPDLAANMWTNPGEFPGYGKDNYGKGFVDDIHGWYFANNDSNP
ncbi:MAG: S8 family serine peptidase, partial [Planctomycetaceae bacterium]